MLKKYNLHDRTWQLVVKRDTRHELNHGPVGCRSSNTRQLGCVFQDMEPPKPILRKSSDMQKPNQRVKFTKAIARHTQNSRPKSFARKNLPRWTSSAQPQRSKNWGSVSGGDRVARARCPRSSVEAGQKCIKLKGARKSNILLTFGKEVLACINS